MMELSVSKSYFKWQGQIRLLKDSGPIGLSLMVVLSESFLQKVETGALNTALNQLSPLSPKSYHRYVDDVHARFNNKEDAEIFLEILNCQEKDIQYTVEPENDKNEINFLDITITNSKSGKYDFKVYRKDAITNIQIQPHSSVDPKIKTGVFKGFISRAYNICSPKYLQAELRFLIEIFVENGYDRQELENIVKTYQPGSSRNSKEFSNNVSMPWIPGVSNKIKAIFKKLDLDITFKSTTNLRTLLCSRNKSKVEKHEKPGVYFTQCACNGKYVGETGCLCQTRLNQHKMAIEKRNKNDSALAEHSVNCDKDINWEETKILSIQPKWYQRKIREALEIQCLNTSSEHENGINRDRGNYVTTDTWKPFFEHWKKVEPNLNRWSNNS